MIPRSSFRPATTVSRSIGSDRYRGWIAGGAAGSADLMRTKPRLSGRNWQIDAMKPGNGCSAAPDASPLKMMKCTCTSGVATFALVRKKPPA